MEIFVVNLEGSAFSPFLNDFSSVLNLLNILVDGDICEVGVGVCMWELDHKLNSIFVWNGVTKLKHNFGEYLDLLVYIR